MNVNIYEIMDYVKKDTWSIEKNEPKRTQNEPKLKKAEMNVTVFYTKGYENISYWVICENEPKTKPIFETAKNNANSFTSKDYEKNRVFGFRQNKAKTNPIYHGAAPGEAGTNPISNSKSMSFRRTIAKQIFKHKGLTAT